MRVLVKQEELDQAVRDFLEKKGLRPSGSVHWRAKQTGSCCSPSWEFTAEFDASAQEKKP